MKGKPKKKGKSPQKLSQKNVQTITSMFRRQSYQLKAGTTSVLKTQSMQRKSDSESDVEITAVETDSKYFGEKSPLKKSWSDTKQTLKPVTKKLSLKRNLLDSDHSNDSNCIAGCSSTSLKENDQTENFQTKAYSKLKLPFRKRRSSQEDAESITKKCKQTVVNSTDINSVIRNERIPIKSVAKISFQSLSKIQLAPDKHVRTRSVHVKPLGDDISDVHKSSSSIDNSVMMSDNEKSSLPSDDTNEESQSTVCYSLKKDLVNRVGRKSSEKYNPTKLADSDFVNEEILEKEAEKNFNNENTTNIEESIINEHQDDTPKENDDEVIQTPYYLENFRTILQTVLDEKDNKNLYNESDLLTISLFQNLSENAQKLYIRLFGRKLAWLLSYKVKYPGIAQDLDPYIKELSVSGFLMTDSELTELEPTLKLLPVTDLKSLAKIYHLNTALNKKELVPLLIKKSKQSTIGSMFRMTGHNAENIMLKRVKKMLGSCLRLHEEPRNVFIRTLMLFSLTDTILDEDMNNGQATQLFRMLQVNIGATVYPQYTVNKQTPVFVDRESLLRFAEASMLESELWAKVEKNNWSAAYDIYMETTDRMKNLESDSSISKQDSELPVYLRHYTALGVYTRILNQGIEVLQRRKNYQDAVTLLEKLLAQDTHCIDYRGRWWERLALNWDAHLKNQEKALQSVENGLKDEHVKVARKLALYLRAEKICSAPKSKFTNRLKNIPNLAIKEAKKIVIEGTVLSDNIPGQRYKFMIADPGGSEDDFSFCGVEQLALEYYKQNGYLDGLHAEGSIITTLFGLFFWDIIFMDVVDAFHGPYQAQPLDMYSTAFYDKRCLEIDDRLKELASSSQEEVCKISEKIWEENFGTLCVGLNWELFSSFQHLQGLLNCIGGHRLSKLLERYAKEPRHTRSGFPDLTLWNPEEKMIKISEVKGPGDRLSHKQMLWLDYLDNIGIDAEVCHVKAVSSKRLVRQT